MAVYFFLGILFLISIPLSVLLTKKILNPVLILNVLWAIIVYLSSLQLFNLKPTSEEIYWIILCGIAFYNIAFFFYYYIYMGLRRNSKHANGIKDSEIRLKALYLFSLVSIVLVMPFFLTSVALLINGGSMATVRSSIQFGEIAGSYSNPVLNALTIFIGNPVSMALNAIVAADFWHGNKNKKLMALCGFSIFIRVIAFGGRNPLIQFIIYFFVSYAFLDKKKSWDFIKKYKKYFLLVTLVLVLIILKVTVSRGSGQPMIRTYYYYYSMEPYMFENWAKVVDSLGVKAYGTAALNGFIFPFFYALRNIFQIPFPIFFETAYELIRQTNSQWVIIAGGTSANAFVSIFWFLYLDGRLLGIIVGMTLYGIISAKTFIKAVTLIRPREVCIYALVVFGLITTNGRSQFADLAYALSFIYVIFLYKNSHYKSKKKHKNERGKNDENRAI